MKSPVKTMPAQESSASVSNGTEPSVKVEMDGTSLSSRQENAPALSPPSASGEILSMEDSFGAAVWNRDKRVNGLYNTKHARNSWMSIAGVGWVKLAVTYDSASAAMSILAAQARTKNCQIDYSVDAGNVNEMYIF
ncbi:hypothetical protein [Dyadobacter sp. NIV53]|uniref:hypothetical protein n=1 Tax=Dyadobacter sp. NIV53 TaxID=2861765 RepID=UPI001C86F5D4|nr:hypothetical protein [Dyadobacter sp. NIV53]